MFVLLFCHAMPSLFVFSLTALTDTITLFLVIGENKLVSCHNVLLVPASMSKLDQSRHTTPSLLPSFFA